MVRTPLAVLALAVLPVLLAGCPEKCVGACGGGGGGSSTGGGSATGGGSTGGGTGTGGAGGGDADAGPPPLSLTDFCARYPALACAHLFAWQGQRGVEHAARALRQSVTAAANYRDFKRLVGGSCSRLRRSGPRWAPTN